MKVASFTCHNCQVGFANREAANKHYSGKWHQHNLLRIMNNTAICSHETYETEMNKSTYLQNARNQLNIISCSACKKNFTSQGSFETHQRSRKHKQNVVRKAAENVRRLQIQKVKEAGRNKTIVMASKANAGGEESAVPEDAQYCTACKAAFSSKKDFISHAQTEKHEIALKAAKLAKERKDELDRQDQIHATVNDDDDDDDMEVEEVDSDEWEKDDADAVVVQQVKDDSKPLPLSVCLLCGKKNANLIDNLGHMERQHSFIVPHQEAGDLEKLQNYLGEKVGQRHQCLECSKEFSSLRACRLHMLDKPHLAIRFEGEFDQFFDISKIMAQVHLPYKPAENEIFAFPLPNGTFLTHRDLRRYFNQRLSLQTFSGIKRLTGSVTAKAITHLGKSSEGKSIQVLRKDNQRRARDINIMYKIKDKKYLDVAVSANKLQKHFRLQVINAG
uniref:Zinc finger protein 622-like n=1 Tax=Hirondellea gigas TaxID=1518452 RepID=A0A2P2HZM0_9CRUS